MNNQIIIQNNKHCSIILSDKNILNSLKQALSYRMNGVEYTQAFKQGWNGYTCLLNSKGIFPLGLLSKVKDVLSKHNIIYELIDKRAPLKFNEPLDISHNLKALGMVPRDYQLEIANAAFNNRKGIIRAATGSGKSLSAALIAAKFNRPTIVYVIGLDLLQQFHTLFTKIFNEPIGFIGDGVCDIQRINIATVWTVCRSLNVKYKMDDEEDEEEDLNIINKLKIKELLKSTELHIFDECHYATCASIKEIHRQMDPWFIYGMSGTPFRDDGSDLLINSMLGDQIIDVPASRLIERGILVQPIIKFVNVPSLPVYGRTYADVYNEYIVENEVRNYLILQETKNLISKGYQTLVLFKHIKHGKILLELFQKNNVDCEILFGVHKLEQREEIKNKLLNKQLKVILASTIYDIGIDIPTLSGLVLAGSGRSSTRCLQRCGRILRCSEGKNYAAVVDFVDNVRFLKQQSDIRYKIYNSEKGFIVKWPKQKYA